MDYARSKLKSRIANEKHEEILGAVTLLDTYALILLVEQRILDPLVDQILGVYDVQIPVEEHWNEVSAALKPYQI